MRCPICTEEPSGAAVWRDGIYHAVACDCGAVVTTPEPPAPRTLEVIEQLHAEPFYAAPARYRAKWLQSVMSPPAKLLEIGCGEGSQLQAFADMGYQVSGLEADPTRAARAKASVEVGFFEDWDPPGDVDVVYHTDLLSHFEDPIDALQKMRRVVRPGGLICFEVGMLIGGPKNWTRWNRNPGLAMHRTLFTRTGLERLIQGAGLKVVNQREHDLALYIQTMRGIGWIQRRRRSAPRPSRAGTPSNHRRRGRAEALLAALRYPVGARIRLGATRTVLIAAQGCS